MLRLSKLTDYAIVIMAYLAHHQGLSLNAKKIAEHTGIPLPTTSKLLKRLSHGHLLFAYRGIKGGYQLAFPAVDISLGKIIQILEGQIALTECSHTTLQCAPNIKEKCTIRSNWRKINSLFHNTLLHISLADLIQPAPNSINNKEKTAFIKPMVFCNTRGIL
jgi:FeS assembly SUF system regulator